MKVMVLLACLGLVFLFFDSLSAHDDLRKSGSIYKKGKRAKGKKGKN